MVVGPDCQFTINADGKMVLATKYVEAGGLIFAVYHADSAKVVYDHSQMHVALVQWADTMQLKIRPARGVATLQPDEFDYFLNPITGNSKPLKGQEEVKIK